MRRVDESWPSARLRHAGAHTSTYSEDEKRGMDALCEGGKGESGGTGRAALRRGEKEDGVMCVRMWVCECVYVWVCECVYVWVCECVYVWV
jgi:hypothetical protein